jgi:hypothetical protein
MMMGEEEDIFVRVGYRACVRIKLIGCAQTFSVFRRYLVTGLPIAGTIEHQVRVYQHPPSGTRDENELEVTGEGFCFRLRFVEGIGRAAAHIWGRPLHVWEIATPLRHLLAWIVDAEGGVMLHAAGVRGTTGVAVLAGPNGSGKSTLAGACARRQMIYLGDDCLPVWDRQKGLGGEYVCAPLYSSLKLNKDMIERLHFGAYKTEFMHRGKSVLDYPSALPGTHPIRAVIVPKVVPSGLALRPLSPFEAMKVIAPSTLLQSSGVSKNALESIHGLCRSVNCYELSTSKDTLRYAPTLIGDLLS